MSEAQRIDALKRHPILGKILDELPDYRREVLLRCILSSKGDFSLPRDEEDAVFEAFADAALHHIERIIQEVIDALNA